MKLIGEDISRHAFLYNADARQLVGCPIGASRVYHRPASYINHSQYQGAAYGKASRAEEISKQLPRFTGRILSF